MQQIPLTKGMVALVDDEDYEWLSKIKWYADKHREGRWYAKGWLKGHKKQVRMHRLILDITDPKVLIDHKNGNGLDNQRHNLRISDTQQNCCNSKISKNNTSHFKGVTWDKSRAKWMAQIHINRKHIYLGYFATAEAAARAYDEAAKRYYGEFAKLNFP